MCFSLEFLIEVQSYQVVGLFYFASTFRRFCNNFIIHIYFILFHLEYFSYSNMSRAQAESVIKNIIREIAQECASKGQAVSETLVAFMVCFGCC